MSATDAPHPARRRACPLPWDGRGRVCAGEGRSATSPALSDADLLALWREARAIAERLCAANLARLRRGDGGFYAADDLWQDLFLEFWALARQWREAGGDEAALWEAWRRRLWGGGRRILRHAPQRLWRGVERASDPAALAMAASPDEQALPGGSAPAVAAALTHPEDAEATRARLEDLDALEEALWRLSVSERQALYRTALLEAPASAVAETLGLEDAAAVHRQVYRARRALRRRLTR